MGKSKPRPGKTSIQCSLTSTPQLGCATTSAVAADPTLGYKIRVLLHDFLHVAKDPNAARRINATTNEHYISIPYFDDSQATIIKAALVDADLGKHDPTTAATEYAQDDADAEVEGSKLDKTTLKGQPFGTVIRALLNNFIDKRRASGDTRPCGPHHLAPLYAWLFGIELKELQDEKFLGRLRRNGV